MGYCSYVGDLKEAPGYWLQPGSTLAIAVIWGLLADERSLLICPSLCNLDFQIGKLTFKQTNKNKNKKAIGKKDSWDTGKGDGELSVGSLN